MTPESAPGGVTFGALEEDRMGPFASGRRRGTFDTDEDLPPCSRRQVDRRVRAAGQSIDRTSNGTDRLAPASSTEHRSIAQPATSTTTADPAHTAGLAARRNIRNTCFRVPTTRPLRDGPPRFGACGAETSPRGSTAAPTAAPPSSSSIRRAASPPARSAASHGGSTRAFPERPRPALTGCVPRSRT